MAGALLLLGILGRVLVSVLGGRRLVAIVADAENAGENANHAADRTAEHATDRTGRLVPGCRPLLNAFDQSLSVRDCGCAEQQREHGPQREPSSQVKPRWRRRVDHSRLHRRTDWPIRVEAARWLQHYRFRRFKVQTQPIAVHARKVFHAKRLCRLIRNCGVIAHGSFQAGSRTVCVAKGAATAQVRRTAPRAPPRRRAQR
ncbi:hypothetical protein ABIF43_004337 [Bradyrhizobium japonicum]